MKWFRSTKKRTGTIYQKASECIEYPSLRDLRERVDLDNKYLYLIPRLW